MNERDIKLGLSGTVDRLSDEDLRWVKATKLLVNEAALQLVMLNQSLLQQRRSPGPRVRDWHRRLFTIVEEMKELENE